MATQYRFVLTSGLAGCYMPDNHICHEANSRRELAEILRAELEYHGFPKSCFSDFRVAEIWRRVQRFKSGSMVHSSAHHKQFVIELRGMTDEEYFSAVEEG